MVKMLLFEDEKCEKCYCRKVCIFLLCPKNSEQYEKLKESMHFDGEKCDYHISDGEL